MKRRAFNRFLLAGGATSVLSPTLGYAQNALPATDSYQVGDIISPEVFVLDREQTRHSLISLLSGNPEAKVNLLFLFGGGDMGGGMPGGIWCQDSLYDMHIIRSLVTNYRGRPLGIIPVACAPVYSTQYLDFPERVFLDSPQDSTVYMLAAEAFISTTQAAVEAGVIPLQPWYDLRLRTMMSRKPAQMPARTSGAVYDWQGKFRAADETQNYGVPNFWLLSPGGVVLSDPFRGNIYLANGRPMQINYTLADIDAAIRAALAD